MYTSVFLYTFVFYYFSIYSSTYRIFRIYLYFSIFLPNKMNYLLKTFGCQMNYADSEKINMILLQSGLRKVLECSETDILILNTCSVRQK